MVQPVLSMGKDCPATRYVWCRSFPSCETKAVAAAQRGNPQHGHSVDVQQARRCKKPSALLIMFLFTYRVWKALTDAPSNTFLSRQSLSGIQVADCAAQSQAKLPAGWGLRLGSGCAVPTGAPCSWPFRILVFLQ